MHRRQYPLLTMSAITIQISDHLRRHVERLAAANGISVDQFFATAASEKLSVIEGFGCVGSRASRADDTTFLEALSHIPDTPVTDSWDKLP